eukprot:8758533-Lingulodinium_polyedra.AAC.1
MERYARCLDKDEATRVERVSRGIKERAADEREQAETGRALATDKPSVIWARVDEEVDHPRPPEGTADDDTD